MASATISQNDSDPSFGALDIAQLLLFEGAKIPTHRVGFFTRHGGVAERN